MMALKARPSLQDWVKSWTATPGYLWVVFWAHLNKASLALKSSWRTTISEIWNKENILVVKYVMCTFVHLMTMGLFVFSGVDILIFLLIYNFQIIHKIIFSVVSELCLIVTQRPWHVLTRSDIIKNNWHQNNADTVTLLDSDQFHRDAVQQDNLGLWLSYRSRTTTKTIILAMTATDPR